ncbi:MAG: VOC family protein [Pseudomonadota bacterium]
MAQRLALTTFLAADYDEAIAWFVDALDWKVLEDEDLGGGKRWVRVAPSEDAETGLLIAKAKGDQANAIGAAAGGRVAFFLHVDDFAVAYERLKGAGVDFEEAPRDEPFGKVVVFRDLYGNRWDLIERSVSA